MVKPIFAPEDPVQDAISKLEMARKIRRTAIMVAVFTFAAMFFFVGQYLMPKYAWLDTIPEEEMQKRIRDALAPVLPFYRKLPNIVENQPWLFDAMGPSTT
jgi:hypothetical protein